MLLLNIEFIIIKIFGVEAKDFGVDVIFLYAHLKLLDFRDDREPIPLDIGPCLQAHPVNVYEN